MKSVTQPPLCNHQHRLLYYIHHPQKVPTKQGLGLNLAVRHYMIITVANRALQLLNTMNKLQTYQIYRVYTMDTIPLQVQ